MDPGPEREVGEDESALRAQFARDPRKQRLVVVDRVAIVIQALRERADAGVGDDDALALRTRAFDQAERQQVELEVVVAGPARGAVILAQSPQLWRGRQPPAQVAKPSSAAMIAPLTKWLCSEHSITSSASRSCTEPTRLRGSISISLRPPSVAQ